MNLSGGTADGQCDHQGRALRTFNFNGGTLQAGANGGTLMSGLTNAYVQNGGAVINVSSGSSTTIGQALLHYAGATTDSLTKPAPAC